MLRSLVGSEMCIRDSIPSFNLGMFVTLIVLPSDCVSRTGTKSNTFTQQLLHKNCKSFGLTNLKIFQKFFSRTAVFNNFLNFLPERTDFGTYVAEN